MKGSERPVRKVDGRDQRRAIETHPSYGVLRVMRHHGLRGPMAGSALPRHDGCIGFELAFAERQVSIGPGDESFYGTQDIIRWDMTHAGFVELMSQMDRWAGVPVTLTAMRSFSGALTSVPDIEWESYETEAIAAQDKVREYGQELVGDIDSLYADTVERLNEAKVSQKKQQEILKPLTDIVSKLSGGMPYAITLLAEATDRVVSAASREVEAKVATTIHELGLEKLAELAELRRTQLREVEEKQIEEIAKLSREEIVALKVQPTMHLRSCGTSYRGCDPNCPVEIWYEHHRADFDDEDALG